MVSSAFSGEESDVKIQIQSLKGKGKIMKKIRYMLLVLVMGMLLSSFLSGCAGVFRAIDILQSTGEEKVVLNERQKALLRELDLPEEYDQLNASQKDGIVMIEKAIVYLEDKYPQKFEYEGYVAGGYDGQYVTLKVVDSCPEEYVNVQIYRKNGRYEFVDDYENILLGKQATAEMKAFLSAYFDSSDIQVYMDVYEVVDGDTAIQRVRGTVNIMIKSIYTEEEVEKAAMAYAQWLQEVHHRTGAVARFRLYSVEDYEKINEFNYTDFFRKQIKQYKLTFDQDEPVRFRDPQR